MSNQANTITATNLGKIFTAADGSPLHALHDISLNVQAGRLTALVGPDGAGKTTFMRLIAGLLKADSGSLNVLGVDVSANPQAVQSRISYMPQRFGLYEDLSVQENLDLYADLHGVPQQERRERFGRMLEMTDMSRFTDRPAGKLSGGMKQKLGLACTLVRTPDLLLLDEPSVGVDPLSRRDLWQIVQQLVDEEQLSVLVSTAYMDEAERCEQVFVMHQGRLLAQGSPAQLRTQTKGLTYSVRPESENIKSNAREVQALLYDAADCVVDAVPKGGEVSFILQPNASLATLMQKLPAIAQMQITPRTEMLEDTFMLLLRQFQTASNNQDKHSNNELNNKQPNNFQTASNATALLPLNTESDKPAQQSLQKPAIVVKDLVRTFGDFTAVASTSFNVAHGEIFGLLGPNGAGKTTTFRMLCGLLPASSGFLEVAGVNLRTARAQARANIGYVSQKFSLYGNLSVKENLAFFGGAYGLRGRALKNRIDEVINQFELPPQAISGLLPAGYKQRLAMAAGLLHRPKILFLDEPTSGIDPLARRAFWRTITTLAQSGVTVIITTHFMEEAEYCDRIAIQDAGKLLALGTPKQVREQAAAYLDTRSNNQAPNQAQGDMNTAFIAIVEQGRRNAHQANQAHQSNQTQGGDHV
ncbi:MAG: ATP-binding cassette domain-containing protein [Moraxella sp.]|nr:ATP-binding cassette domain-containing protein [Moraxella sp.]